MGKRFLVLMVCVVAVMALCAPAALATIAVTGVSPSSGAGGQSVTCTIEGTFYTTNIVFDAQTPSFELIRSGTTIAGTTNSWNSGAANVTFAIPSSASQGSYELHVTQSHKLYNVTFWTKDETTFANAFTVTAAPPPTVGTINPTSVWAGCVRTDIVLTVTGTNFVNGSRIVLNGVETTSTAFVSATQLTVPLAPANMAATVATLMVTVKNPPFPPGTSSGGGLPIALQQETTTPTVIISGADDGWHNAPVALTFAATDSQSGIQKVQYMSAPVVPTWTDATSYTIPTSTQGAVTVSVQALDWCNKTGTAQATVNIDTTRPKTETQGDVKVSRNKTAKLKFLITKPEGLSPTADVTITIKRGSGSTAKTLKKGDAPVNSTQTASFKCTLPKGTYTWTVYATDSAGNKQANAAKAKLTVK